jgi:hypothetical protein
MKKNKKRCYKRPLLSLLGIIAIGALIMIGLGGCNTLQSIEVSREPTRTVYGQGQELDRSGLAVMAHYKKNSEAVSTASLQFSGYDKGKTGKQTVTVTMTTTGFITTEKSTTFTVTVVPVEKVSIQQPPAVTVFMQGNDFDPVGLIVWAEYENGAVPGVTISPAQLKFLGYNKNTAGSQTVIADYYGKQASFDVSVAALTRIIVTSPPNNTTDYFTGEDLDTTGLAVTGTWEGMGEKPLSVAQVTLSGFNKERAGKQDVLVTYQGKTASFSVTVVAMQAVSVFRPPEKLIYAYGENLDLAGLAVQGTRAGATSTEQVDVSRLKISGYSSSTGGSQTITVTIGGKSSTFKVTVAPLGTWRARVPVPDSQNFQQIPVTLVIMDEKSWSLSVDSDTFGGAYTLQGTHVTFSGGGERAPRAADISPSGLRLTGGGMLDGLVLTK